MKKAIDIFRDLIATGELLPIGDVDDVARKVSGPPKPTLEVIFRDPEGATHCKQLTWLGPTRKEDLAAYIENYFAPLPHCARIHHRGLVLAEWYPSASPAQPAESLVTAGSPPGSGGIPNV